MFKLKVCINCKKIFYDVDLQKKTSNCVFCEGLLLHTTIRYLSVVKDQNNCYKITNA